MCRDFAIYMSEIYVKHLLFPFFRRKRSLDRKGTHFFSIIAQLCWETAVLPPFFNTKDSYIRQFAIFSAISDKRRSYRQESLHNWFLDILFADIRLFFHTLIPSTWGQKQLVFVGIIMDKDSTVCLNVIPVICFPYRIGNGTCSAIIYLMMHDGC